MKYQVVLERDEETGAVTATVPGLPIVVDANSEQEALAQARKAILFWFEENPGKRQGTVATQPSHARVATVDV
jgi:predicted RNase H-like HicB family nuclease